MKRRKFGLMAGSSLAAIGTSVSLPALAQTADPALLTTTLTPLGGERAGNADGSIPAWTGGLSSPRLPSTTPVDVPMFGDEAPLYTVDASNMAQYAHLLAPGTQHLITASGLSLKVYQTHRTSAAPQYVYDNTAKNVTRASLNPGGGRLGFSGAYGGIPFPIINTADPLVGGAQLIWNHLLAWGGYQDWTQFTPGFVITGNTIVLTFGGSVRYVVPYYDPNGSPEAFDGYYSKEHAYFKAPATANGQEALVWTSTNVQEKPDITWSLVNGQGRVRKAPDEAYDTPNPSANGINNYDDASGFAGSPQKYDWKVIGKQEMLIPYNNNNMRFENASDIVKPGRPNPDLVRWEKHRVWVLEATLHPGERNTSAKRMAYLDEDTFFIALTDCFDAQGDLIKHTTVYFRCIPSLPGLITLGYACWNTNSGDYTIILTMKYPPYGGDEYFAALPPATFDPQQMAASASF